MMILNEKKTKFMIFNFCKSKIFDTRLYIEKTLLEQVRETKLLGVHLSEDLTWHSNTNSLVKRAYARMEILRRLSSFNVPKKQLVQIYMLYIRSVTEQSSVVWSSSITEEESEALERTQKVALKIIYQTEYLSYSNALFLANLPTLVRRRETLLYNFGVKTFKNPKTTHFIRRNHHSKILRNQEVFTVEHARTTRFAKSALNSIAHMLNARPPS